MTETEFLNLIDATLSQIEHVLETAGQRSNMDVECDRTDSILEVEFLQNHSKMIISSQVVLQQLWVAAKSGGFHYRYDGQVWRNTRDNTELMGALAQMVLAQGGLAI